MATETMTRPEQDQTFEKKIHELRELFTDAPELGKKALENALPILKREVAAATRQESAGRRRSSR